MGLKALRVINREQCIGCFSCMHACSRMLRGLGGTSKAAMRVLAYTGTEGAFSIRVCLRCAEPDCAAACPTGALKVAPGGGVRLDKDLCTSCGNCVAACTIAALQWDGEEGMPIPCIHCGQCVRYCPNNVIALVEKNPGREENPDAG